MKKRDRSSGQKAESAGPAARVSQGERQALPAAIKQTGRKVRKEQSRGPQPKPDTAVKRPVSAHRLLVIERRKARSRAIGLSIFVLAIMLITVLLIIAVMQQSSPRPRLMFLTEGTIDHAVRSQGLIMRDEIIVYSAAEGLLKPLATEGSRTARGQKLALIIPADRSEQLQELKKVEKDLVDLQISLMNSGYGAGARAIYDESAASLAAIANLIRSDTSRGDLTNLTAYSASIAVILEQRTSKLTSVDFRDARIDELQRIRTQLELSLGLESGTIYCDTPGMVSFKLDGLEPYLSNEQAETIDTAAYNRFISESETMTGTGRQVTADQPVLRIVTGHQQTLVFLLPEMSASDLVRRDFYDIHVPADGITIRQAYLVRAEPADEGALAVFSTDRMVERLSDRRIVQAEIITSSRNGLRVPLSALKERDENRQEASLMIVSGGYTRMIRVAVIDHDREYAIIEGLPGQPHQPAISTVIVVNPDALEEGEFIGST